MTSPYALSDSRRARLAACGLFESFRRYRCAFERTTRQAQRRFETRDWQGMRDDAGQRLNLRALAVAEAVSSLRTSYGERVADRLLWASMKAVYSHLLEDAPDGELAETFFNSVTRQVFCTVGVDAQLEFVLPDCAPPAASPSTGLYRSYPGGGLEGLVSTILRDIPIDAPCEDIVRDASLAAERIRSQLKGQRLKRAEMLGEVFYRGKAAYLVGRLVTEEAILPFVMALLNESSGIFIDAVLTDADAVSVLFSFTHAYFHVRAERPSEFVAFLRSLLPAKRLSELYTSLGFHKHGKTELYRELLAHLAGSPAPFETAPGIPGMVMSVFGQPEDDLVVKVIRDHFAPPKDTSRAEIRKRYDLVFRHDRAGRLIEAHEFEHLRFSRRDFSSQCLAELLSVAGNTVTCEGEDVILRHAYVERRVTPLDLYLRSARGEETERVLGDFGDAIKDLAFSNIFPGDMISKNFGVTRLGRVVFYDYDELCLLERCRFRALPEAATPEQEMAAEPWYHVGPDDMFPEQWLPFLGLPRALRETFVKRHADLLHPAFWQGVQARLAAGELISILPYQPQQRLGARSPKRRVA